MIPGWIESSGSLKSSILRRTRTGESNSSRRWVAKSNFTRWDDRASVGPRAIVRPAIVTSVRERAKTVDRCVIGGVAVHPTTLADNLLLHWLHAKYWYENNNDPTALTRLSEAVVWVWLTRDDVRRVRRGVCPKRAMVTQLWCFDYHLLKFSHQCMIISSIAIQFHHNLF